MTTLLSVIVIAIGATLRYSIMETSISIFLQQLNEIVTPLTSWKRVIEGIALQDARISPYEGDLLHEPPLILFAFSKLKNIFGQSTYMIFLIADISTVLLLRRFAKHVCRYMLQQQANEVCWYDKKGIEFILKVDDLKLSSYYVALAWSFSPWAISTCVAQSTAVFTNLFIALYLHSIVTDRHYRAILSLSIASYLSLYSILLAVPLVLYKINKILDKDSKSNSTINEYYIILQNIFSTLLSISIVIFILLYASYMINGSWNFIEGTYGYILFVPDYTPNMGVFWYFFAEMFEHFRSFFLVVFQMNLFLYAVPLAIRFREEPFFLSCVLLIFIAVFKSYPSYADMAVYMAILPIWRHLTTWVRNSLVVSIMLFVSSILAPVLSYLWLWAGSANANFYFAISLVHATAQIFLVTDFIYSYICRQHALKHGKDPLLENELYSFDDEFDNNWSDNGNVANSWNAAETSNQISYETGHQEPVINVVESNDNIPRPHFLTNKKQHDKKPQSQPSSINTRLIDWNDGHINKLSSGYNFGIDRLQNKIVNNFENNVESDATNINIVPFGHYAGDDINSNPKINYLTNDVEYLNTDKKSIPWIKLSNSLTDITSSYSVEKEQYLRMAIICLMYQSDRSETQKIRFLYISIIRHTVTLTTIVLLCLLTITLYKGHSPEVKGYDECREEEPMIEKLKKKKTVTLPPKLVISPPGGLPPNYIPENVNPVYINMGEVSDVTGNAAFSHLPMTIVTND